MTEKRDIILKWKIENHLQQYIRQKIQIGLVKFKIVQNKTNSQLNVTNVLKGMLKPFYYRMPTADVQMTASKEENDEQNIRQ